MTDRYDRIRDALKMGPTPGPWGLTELSRDIQREGYKFSISRGGLGWWIAKVTHEANGGSGVANATYIAACDPDTIRELLAERDQLAAALEAAREEVDALAKDAGKYRWGINNARWIRSEQEAYVAIPVASDADLSCVAMRDAAIDAAIDQARGRCDP